MIWKKSIIKYLKVLNSRFFVFLLFVAVLVSCVKKPDHKELIFLISLDTTRADSINYNTGNKETPNLAYLASKGVSYKNAYSLIPITLPSHYSMFYSMPPWKTEVYNNGDKTKQKYSGLADLLKKKGYFTGAVISLGVLKSDFGINKGFMEYEEKFSPGLWYRTAEEVNDDLFKMLDKVKRKKSFYWVHYSDPHDPYYKPEYKGSFNVSFNGKDIYATESTKSITVSLTLNLVPGKNILKLDTKIPDNFSNEMKKNITGFGLRGFEIKSLSKDKNFTIIYQKNWKKRIIKKRTDFVIQDLNSKIQIFNNEKIIQPVKISFVYDMRLKNSIKKTAYLEEVSYMDRKIGDLVAFLKGKKLFKHSTFIIMGDHGEGFEEYRGHIGHIHYLNKVYSNVPMIVSGYKIEKNGIKNKLVSNLNIAPTILDIAGIKKPKYMMGNSLLKNLDNKSLFLATYRPQAYYNSFSLIEYPYQIIYFPEKTNADKYEFINLEKDRFGVNNIIGNNIIKKRLIKKIRKMAKFCLNNKKGSKMMSKKDKEILRSLGYL